MVNGGKFGERWGKICKTFGVQVTELKVEWGHAVNPQLVADALKKDPAIKAVYVQASETSTGVSHDVKALGEIVKAYDQTILVVDAITALGVFDIKTDAWGLDVVITGSQKALMLPPGLAFVSVSEKAWGWRTRPRTRPSISTLRRNARTRPRIRRPSHRRCR